MLSFSSTVYPSQTLVGNAQPVNNISPTTQHPHLHESTKVPYQVAQQVKFLHLEAEVESLLQQLQTLKQQRIAAQVEALQAKSVQELSNSYEFWVLSFELKKFFFNCSKLFSNI